MNKETKDAVDRVTQLKKLYDIKDSKFAHDFRIVCDTLRRLEDVESLLTHGGFIPDRAGRPCKDGDAINICLDGLRSGQIVHGHLCWDLVIFNFHAIDDQTGEFIYIDSTTGEAQWFENVSDEKEDKDESAVQ